MKPARFSLTLCLLLLLVSTPRLLAQSLRPAANLDVYPWKDDAALRDVEFVGTKAGWAVGDHGTVWKTADGGQSWMLTGVPVPADCSLRSVCCLVQRLGEGQIVGTSQIAWVAGRGTKPYSRAGYGVLLKTTDGGKSWQMLGEGMRLPPLNFVRFFGPDEGIAVGESTPEFPTGVLVTEDGGLTWRPAPGVRTAGWHAGAFNGFHDGFVVGPRGRVSLVAGTNVAPPRTDPGSLRAIRAVASGDGLTGWAVGDGALVLKSDNGGVTWEAPPNDLPSPLSMFADFEAVACRDDDVWIAGKPGGAVWHSMDGGQSWRSHSTGVTVPIHALTFSTDDIGFAVGALGTILRTDDAGWTWKTLRGASKGQPRRAAILGIHSTVESIPFGTVTAFGGDDGQRSASLVVARHDSGAEDDAVLERRLSDAVTCIGGSAASLGWRLPLTVPELETDQTRLTETWQLHTEGRLGEVMLSKLVAEIRTWRPSVLIIDAKEENAVAGLIDEAIRRATVAAADPTAHFEQMELAGLKPWKVKRTYVRIPAEDGSRLVRPYTFLRTFGTTVDDLASKGRSRLLPGPLTEPQAESLDFLIPLYKDQPGSFGIAATKQFRFDLPQTSGSDARRPPLPSPPAGDVELAHQQSIEQKNFRKISQVMYTGEQRGAQLIAEIRSQFRDMPPSQAALQIVHLANDYRRRGEWDLAEAAMIEAIELHADQPAAAEAMLWLMHLWSSEEMAWQRSRGVNIDARQQTTNRQAISGRMERLLQATGRRQDDPVRLARELSGDPLANLQTTTTLPQQNPGSWQAATMTFWQRQSLQMGRLIRRRMPQAYRTHEVTWPLASVLRRQGYEQPAGSIYRKLMSLDKHDPVSRIAAGEVWLSNPADQTPPHLTYSTWVAERPYLDGSLGDECWREAKEIRLASATADNRTAEVRTSDSYAFAQIANDDQFLYIAANVPRSPRTPDDGPQYDGRTHDADHSGFDRIRFELDIDRDYTTAYRIEVDQRGHVSESCWEDTSWNPKLAVAADGDATHWRIEMAIPLSELTWRTPDRNTTWAVSIVRTTPHVGWQSWVHPAGRESQPGSFGIVQFR